MQKENYRIDNEGYEMKDRTSLVLQEISGSTVIWTVSGTMRASFQKVLDFLHSGDHVIANVEDACASPGEYCAQAARFS